MRTTAKTIYTTALMAFYDHDGALISMAVGPLDTRKSDDLAYALARGSDYASTLGRVARAVSIRI